MYVNAARAFIAVCLAAPYTSALAAVLVLDACCLWTLCRKQPVSTCSGCGMDAEAAYCGRLCAQLDAMDLQREQTGR